MKILKNLKPLSLSPTTIFLIALTFTYIGSTLQTGVFNNFAAEELKIRADQLGIYESLRESPGIIAVFVIALLMFLKEQYLAALATLLMAAGYFFYSRITEWHQLLLIGFIGSLGLHIHLPVSNAIAIFLAKENKQGQMLGRVQRFNFVGQFISMAIIIILGKKLSYRMAFVLSAISLLIASVCYLSLPKDLGYIEKPKIIVKKKYWVYYILTFLEGCRKQVFITFALFVLVKVYKMQIRYTAILMLFNAIMVIIFSPFIGYSIDRYGERTVLFISYFLVFFVFIGYAFFHNIWLLIACYTIDNILYLGSISLTSYIGKLVPKNELRPTLSMGVTMNHIAAVAMPIIGGILWEKLGYEVVFMIGAVIVIISLVFIPF
ncbi:MAG TPA: MFS transporter, partial [Exilispira sp.]|nr:MFS transporter [Exilispira sp.]